MSVLPTPRGPLSSAVLAHLCDAEALPPARLKGIDPLEDGDLHLALWCCYQLHYGGFDGIDDGAEWDVDVLRFRACLESAFEGALRTEHRPDNLPSDPLVALRVASTWASPPLSMTVEASPTRQQLEELAIHRSPYQLQAADPHTWAIPRLSGPGRSAMIEIQADAYGLGRPGESHAELFAAALEEMGLVARAGHYIDRLPGTTIATANLASMFGLNRRLRGALVGHLALFKMTSVAPMVRYRSAALHVGGLPALERFYEAHVKTDAHHTKLALQNMVAGVLMTEPDLAPDVIFGAAALSRVEARFAQYILAAWRDGRSSLRTGLAEVLSDPQPVSKSG